MKVFLTGASGLVGSYIARELIKAGHQLVAIKRVHTSLKDLNDTQTNIEWHDAEILDPLAIDKAMQGCDVIVHSAAIVSFNKKDKDTMMATNVEGTALMVNLALRNNIHRFIHISSIAALGKEATDGIITEEAQWKENSNNTAYAESKYLSELEVWRGAMEGLSVSILNPTVVLGPSDWNRSSTQLFKYVYNQAPFYTQGFINFVDVRDVAEICRQLVEKPSNNRRYILNSGQVSYQDFFSIIAKHFGKKAPYILVKGFWLRVAASIEAIRSTLTGADPLITKETANMADKRYHYSNQRAVEELDHQFRTLEQSVQWTCQQLQRE